MNLFFGIICVFNILIKKTKIYNIFINKNLEEYTEIFKYSIKFSLQNFFLSFNK